MPPQAEASSRNLNEQNLLPVLAGVAVGDVLDGFLDGLEQPDAGKVARLLPQSACSPMNRHSLVRPLIQAPSRKCPVPITCVAGLGLGWDSWVNLRTQDCRADCACNQPQRCPVPRHARQSPEPWQVLHSGGYMSTGPTPG